VGEREGKQVVFMLGAPSALGEMARRVPATTVTTCGPDWLLGSNGGRHEPRHRAKAIPKAWVIDVQ
jgi:hypothetical protein